MRKENHSYELSENKHHVRRAINQLSIGFIIVLWGSLLILKQAGIIEKDVSTWPFAFVAFGMLLILGGIYRLYSRKRSVRVEEHVNI
jgi:hypothetical protein